MKLVTFFDPMDDGGELSARPEHRRVAWAPVTLLEAAALRLGLADIVFLHRHGVGATELDHALQRGAQVAHTIGRRIVGVIRKDLEQPAPKDRGPLGLRGTQIGVAHGDDAEVGLGQHQIEAGAASNNALKSGMGGDRFLQFILPRRDTVRHVTAVKMWHAFGGTSMPNIRYPLDLFDRAGSGL